MVDTSQLTELISALRAETEADSVSPERVGYVLQRIVDGIESLNTDDLRQIVNDLYVFVQKLPIKVSASDGLFYTDANGYVAMRYTPSEGMDAAKVSKHLASLILNHLNTPEPGFYYTDASGHVAMKYTPSEGFDVAKLSEHFKSLLPAGGGGDYSDLTETIYNI